MCACWLQYNIESNTFIFQTRFGRPHQWWCSRSVSIACRWHRSTMSTGCTVAVSGDSMRLQSPALLCWTHSSTLALGTPRPHWFPLALVSWPLNFRDYEDLCLMKSLWRDVWALLTNHANKAFPMNPQTGTSSHILKRYLFKRSGICFIVRRPYICICTAP